MFAIIVGMQGRCMDAGDQGPITCSQDLTCKTFGAVKQIEAELLVIKL